MENKLLLSVNDVGDLVGRSSRTIERWVKDGILPRPLMVNGRSNWRRSSIDEWLQAGCPRRPVRRR
jgi:predicted DNA-binding transcriptional regulator AlpA